MLPIVEVQGLGKVFARGRVALAGVSFTARPGGVLGFLGANGAGKTTTMRILAGYLRPSSGTATVCGHDVAAESTAARRRIGYLPEQVPLYPEMRIREYLRYRAQLRGLPWRARQGAAQAAMAQVGLAGHEDRIIGQLSLGFRQRVGLADALLHQPPVLILDEPTSGLDPNQRREVLDLISHLARERTIILSTHVLPEVERVCSAVVIIHQGKVVASGAPQELAQRLVERGLIEVRCRGDREALLRALQLPGVAQVEESAQPGAPLCFRVRLGPEREADPARACEELARAVLSCGELQGLSRPPSDLEAVFRWLTQPAVEPPLKEAAR